MIASRNTGIAKLGIVCQCLAAAAVFWLWLLLVQGRGTFWTLNLTQYVHYVVVMIFGIVFAFATAPRRSWFAQLSFNFCHRLALRQTFFAAGLLMFWLVGARDQTISRVFLFTFVPVLYGLLMVTQRFLPPLLQKMSYDGIRFHRILVAGGSQNVSKLRGWLASKERGGYSIVGMISHGQNARDSFGVQQLGAMEDLERIIVEQDITHVVMAEFSTFRHIIAHYTAVCERHGVRLLVICDFESALRHPVTMFEDEGVRFIGLREEPLEDPLGRIAKRCLDIAVALPVVIFILPFTTVLVALLQWRSSPARSSIARFVQDWKTSRLPSINIEPCMSPIPIRTGRRPGVMPESTRGGNF
jgi:putative colanic acid biosynthesis UDP-glucose lipid carrier transferase